MIGDENGRILADSARHVSASVARRQGSALGAQLSNQAVVLDQATAELKRVSKVANVNSAKVDAIAAQRDALLQALLAAVPNHPLLKQVGVKNDGKPATELTNKFDAAFDASLAKSMPGVDPKQHRTYRVR